MEKPDPGTAFDNRPTRWMEAAIPILSFGGAALAIIIWKFNIPVALWITILGCVVASCLLAYLAWIRPKKDIVALTTPIYSFVFLAAPVDALSTIILELLYATSLSIMLVRLKHRFSAAGTAMTDKTDLPDSLKDYTEKTRDALSGISPDTAHQAARAFVRFAEGEYLDAARISGDIILHKGAAGLTPVLDRAFSIVREHATIMDQSLSCPDTFLTFLHEDAGLLALPVSPFPDTNEAFYSSLDNALLLLFSTAWNASEKDRPHLLESAGFAQNLIGTS